MDLTPTISYVLGGGVLAVATGLIRWGVKVDRSLTKTAASIDLLSQKLNGHEKRIDRLETLS